MSYLKRYFQYVPEDDRTPSAIAYMASLDAVQAEHPLVADKIVQEIKDQRSNLKLIASENYSSLAVQLSMGNLLTDKYAEGYPGRRFYAGCENVDAIEDAAVQSVKKLFGCDHAYVQPHSGADANLVAFWAILINRIQNAEITRLSKKTLDELTDDEYEKIRVLLCNQKVMGMALGSGGHLTHGYRHNVSSKFMRSVSYHVDKNTGLIDYKELAEQVKREKPLILVAGYSSYPRLINFAKMREIADSVGAVLMSDMAHFAGLVAGKAIQGEYDPIPFSHIVTSTTHKTLRGPRGGIVLCTKEFQEAVDKGCPMILGGPLPHVLAAKAIAFKEALAPSFRDYAEQIIKNAKALAKGLMDRGAVLTTNGTDNHLLVINVAESFGLNGRQAEMLLREAHITVNRNAIPFDPNGVWFTSGVRIGTPALTTLGMKEEEMDLIAEWMIQLLKSARAPSDTKAKAECSPDVLGRIQKNVMDLLEDFPLYPELVIDEKSRVSHNAALSKR
jgi:glycine hydroxymethyltransferase